MPGGGIFKVLQHIWTIFNGPNNEPIVVGLVVGWVALLGGYITIFLNYRSRLRDKDGEIERLIGERDKLQDFVLTKMGAKRLTTTSPPDKGRGK